MFKQTIWLIIGSLFFMEGLAQNRPESIEIMTFNLRFNTPKDELNRWPYRKDKVASQIIFHKADIVGTQESQYGMVLDLQERLKDYKWIGIQGTNKKDSLDSEWNAIFYNHNRFRPIRSGNFWLSENPEEFNVIGWDAQQGRVALWVHFKDKRTGKDFYFINTHFDHVGKLARKESAILVLKKIKEIANDKPVIVTGDFNTRPDTEPITILTDPSDPNALKDSKSISLMPHYGPDSTFNDFGNEKHPGTIDYIFVNNKVKVLRHATLSETWSTEPTKKFGKYSSDHFPVLATLLIN